MNAALVQSCAVFLLYAILLLLEPRVMFTDPDTYWHLAAGDLIRQLGALPRSDPWSFTAAGAPWVNTAWGWDVILSYAYRQGGWHAVVTMNALTLAATLAVIFAHCLLRTDDGISAFVATLAASVLIFATVRPHQCTFLFTALLLLLLAQASSGRMRGCWPLLIPLLMIPWVNLHGGFLIGFFLIGVYGLEAMLGGNQPFFRMIFAAGAAAFIVSFLNPYGSGLYVAIAGLFSGSVMKSLIMEWQPLSFSGKYIAIHIYLFAFIALVMMRRLPLARNESWAAYAWLALGLSSMRNVPIFAIVSAPLLAVGLGAAVFSRRPASPRPPGVERLCRFAAAAAADGKAAFAVLLLTAATAGLLFTPTAARLLDTASFDPAPDLSHELAFIKKHYPDARLLNTYNLGGPLIFAARGAVPVFIDGREITAYPPRVMRDYVAFYTAEEGWADMLERYRLDGVLLMSTDHKTADRFTDRKGWHLAFKGKTATLFMRDEDGVIAPRR